MSNSEHECREEENLLGNDVDRDDPQLSDVDGEDLLEDDMYSDYHAQRELDVLSGSGLNDATDLPEVSAGTRHDSERNNLALNERQLVYESGDDGSVDLTRRRQMNAPEEDFLVGILENLRNRSIKDDVGNEASGKEIEQRFKQGLPEAPVQSLERLENATTTMRMSSPYSGITRLVSARIRNLPTEEESKPTTSQSRGSFKLNVEETVYRNYPRSTIQESLNLVTAGCLPHSKDAILTRDTIELTGASTSNYDGSMNNKQRLSVFNTMIVANHIARSRQIESDGLTDEEIKTIRELSKDPQKLVDEFKRLKQQISDQSQRIEMLEQENPTGRQNNLS